MWNLCEILVVTYDKLTLNRIFKISKIFFQLTIFVCFLEGM